MSTPCVVEFKDGNEKHQIYVHHDGYPEHMIPLLKDFLSWNHSCNDNASYTAANFIYWYKNKSVKRARQVMGHTEQWHKAHKDFLLQVEQTGVGFWTGTRKAMYESYIHYCYKVTLGGIDEPKCYSSSHLSKTIFIDLESDWETERDYHIKLKLSKLTRPSGKVKYWMEEVDKEVIA